jgi:hypothetical protein
LYAEQTPWHETCSQQSLIAPHRVITYFEMAPNRVVRVLTVRGRRKEQSDIHSSYEIVHIYEEQGPPRPGPMGQLAPGGAPGTRLITSNNLKQFIESWLGSTFSLNNRAYKPASMVAPHHEVSRAAMPQIDSSRFPSIYPLLIPPLPLSLAPQSLFRLLAPPTDTDGIHHGWTHQAEERCHRCGSG